MLSTENIGLKKPGYNDEADIAVINENSDIIDREFGNRYLKSETYSVEQVNNAIAQAIEALPNGLVYRGAVNYYNDLPTANNKLGDTYSVKYQGETGTTADGNEYAWGEYDGTLQWIKLGVNAYTKDEIDKQHEVIKSDILSNEQEIARVETSLQSQIDSIVLESSESGNVTAEVVQARTDVNGLNHTTLKERIDIIDEAVVKNKISIPIGIEVGAYDENGSSYDNNTRARTIYYLPANPITCKFKFPIGTKHRILYYAANSFLSMSDWSESTKESIKFPDTNSNVKIRLLIGYVDNRVITTENIPTVYMEYDFDFSSNKIPFIDGYAITATENIQKYSGFRLSTMIPVEVGKSYKASKFRNTQTFNRNGQAVRLLATVDIVDETITINEDEAYVCFCWRATDAEEMYFAEKDKFIEGKTIDNLVNYPLISKKLSLLGDSISAYTGTVPVGNDVYYTGSNSGVTSPNQMWWSVLCRKTGMIPLIINAWSGSAITQLTDTEHSSKVPMSDVSRCQALHSDTENPDVILIAGGVNDFSYAQSKQHNPNDWDGKNAPVKGNSFTETYACMIKDIQSAYPNAIVICLSTWFTMRGTDNGYTRVNGTGYTQADYNAEIRKVAELMHVPFIDVSQCGFNRNNFYPNYATDSASIPTHPNSVGHKIMGTYLADTVSQIVRAFVNN
jgi:lysophospholipase L1-like esterase